MFAHGGVLLFFYFDFFIFPLYSKGIKLSLRTCIHYNYIFFPLPFVLLQLSGFLC